MSPRNNGVLAKTNNPFQDDRDSACGDVFDTLCRRLTRSLASLFVFLRGNGPRLAVNLAGRGVWTLRRNLTRRRVLSFPHLLVLVWAFVLLRGEGWIFHWKVDKCSWDHWEDWVRIPPVRPLVSPPANSPPYHSPKAQTPITSSSSPTRSSRIPTPTLAARGPSPTSPSW